MGIHLYTEPGCSACVDAKAFLASRGILFEERDIRANPEYQRILTEEIDSCTTPTLVAGHNIIIGFDRAEYELLPSNSAIKHGTDLDRGERS
jgi:glutaredoxin